MEEKNKTLENIIYLKENNLIVTIGVGVSAKSALEPLETKKS